MSTRSSFRAASRAFRSLSREMRKVEDRGLREIGEEIMTDVKASRSGKGVPVDKGPLRASGHVVGPDRKGEVVLGFGGPAGAGNLDGDTNSEDVGYAVVQHEDLTLRHEVGEARYLVRGVERWRADGSAAMEAIRQMADQAVRRAG